MNFEEVARQGLAPSLLDTMWHSRLDHALWSNREPHVYVGPIAAGEAVVATDTGRIAVLSCVR
jgi:hypothetical protein